MTTAKVEIDVNGVGRGTVTIDGQNVPVRAVDVRAAVGDATRVLMEFPAPSVIARMSDVDVVAVFDGLNVEEMVRDLEGALWPDGAVVAWGEDLRVRFERCLTVARGFVAGRGGP